jgi:hypothetical protein
VFDFRMGREWEVPKRFLGNFEGILQSDGYTAYDHVGGPKIVHAEGGRIFLPIFRTQIDLDRMQARIRMLATMSGRCSRAIGRSS